MHTNAFMVTYSSDQGEMPKSPLHTSHHSMVVNQRKAAYLQQLHYVAQVGHFYSAYHHWLHSPSGLEEEHTVIAGNFH